MGGGGYFSKEATTVEYLLKVNGGIIHSPSPHPPKKNWVREHIFKKLQTELVIFGKGKGKIRSHAFIIFLTLCKNHKSNSCWDRKYKKKKIWKEMAKKK